MPLKVFNTATRSLDPFEPIEEGKVRVYACGPTIYDHAHIGNFRTFVFFDLVHRYLEWSGYDVTFVMNLTDVDDKTIEGASRAGTSVEEFTAPFGAEFLADSETLGIRRADRYPRATHYIGPMVEFIQRLIDGGHAYQADDGAVYFSIDSFPGYGKLKRIDPSSLRAGARVAQDEYEKEDARDFALWKRASDVDEGVGAAWDTPWGRGRPGWHLECSVMSVTELGATLDMHLGGEDLIFPHHENEIAQSEAATGQPFVRNWLHVKHLQLEGRKMSKSLGNFVTVRELLDEGYDGATSWSRRTTGAT
jgi:cysteinyl-tRNA synthetase